MRRSSRVSKYATQELLGSACEQVRFARRFSHGRMPKVRAFFQDCTSLLKLRYGLVALLCISLLKLKYGRSKLWGAERDGYLWKDRKITDKTY